MNLTKWTHALTLICLADSDTETLKSYFENLIDGRELLVTKIDADEKFLMCSHLLQAKGYYNERFLKYLKEEVDAQATEMDTEQLAKFLRILDWLD